MAFEVVNGTRLHHEVAGEGDAVVLVHGSWGDASTWGLVVPGLAESFRVVSYDRRGHGDSGGAPEAGTVHDDVADLAALIELLELAPANLVANSYGSCIALRLTVDRPELVRRTAVHEPPCVPLLADVPAAKSILEEFTESIGAVRELLESGDNVAAAKRFVDTVALGPGMWSQLPPEIHGMFTHHAPTFLGELRDRDALAVDLDALASVRSPVLLSHGDQSPPIFAPILERLAEAMPGAQRHTYTGAGHVPHLTHPDEFVGVVTRFLRPT